MHGAWQQDNTQVNTQDVVKQYGLGYNEHRACIRSILSRGVAELNVAGSPKGSCMKGEKAWQDISRRLQ